MSQECQERNERPYLITSSASATNSCTAASNVGGTSRPSALAVWRLITNSNLVGCSTASSATT